MGPELESAELPARDAPDAREIHDSLGHCLTVANSARVRAHQPDVHAPPRPRAATAQIRPRRLRLSVDAAVWTHLHRSRRRSTALEGRRVHTPAVASDLTTAAPSALCPARSLPLPRRAERSPTCLRHAKANKGRTFRASSNQASAKITLRVTRTCDLRGLGRVGSGSPAGERVCSRGGTCEGPRARGGRLSRSSSRCPRDPGVCSPRLTAVRESARGLTADPDCTLVRRGPTQRAKRLAARVKQHRPIWR